jgi:porphobilinogen deaminase
VPVAAYAELKREGDGTSLRLHGRVIALQGDKIIEGHQGGVISDDREAAMLGFNLADRLHTEGASEILAQVRSTVMPAVTEP